MVRLPEPEAKSGKAETYCDDLENFTGYARAVFKDDKTGNKYMTWREEKQAIRLDGELDHDLGDPKEVVEQSFSDVCDAEVSQEIDQEVDKEVYDRLEELGYA